MEGCIMKQSCWSCKYCINDYFATGTMDCKKQDDMTEDEFENYYGDNGGENCPYYEEERRFDVKYCHYDYKDEQHDCLDYMECEECPYYCADID